MGQFYEDFSYWYQAYDLIGNEEGKWIFNGIRSCMVLLSSLKQFYYMA